MIQIDVDADDALKRLLNIVDGLEQARPLYKTLGDTLTNLHQDRFDAEVSPTGEAWASLSPKTTKRKKFGKILYRSGALRNTLRYNASDREVRFGTDRKYGIYHQFGTWQMPARPWLGVSKSDEKVLMQKTTDYLKRIIG